jgi:glucan phosphoethanolaminetransferase (alkaline phosphatase superfamily)
MRLGCAADIAKAVFAWPLYATWNAAAYANTYPSFVAKAATFLTMLPVLILTTAVWAMLWAAAWWLLRPLVF